MSVFLNFKPLNLCTSCLRAFVCIPEVRTLLLTPILPYQDMTNVGCHMCHLCQKCQKCHIWRIYYLTHITSIYGNMGVKRCVRISEMQTNTSKQLVHRFTGLKYKNTDVRDFPLYFSRFPLYNWFGLCYAPKRFHEKFL